MTKIKLIRQNCLFQIKTLSTTYTEGCSAQNFALNNNKIKIHEFFSKNHRKNCWKWNKNKLIKNETKQVSIKLKLYYSEFLFVSFFLFFKIILKHKQDHQISYNITTLCVLFCCVVLRILRNVLHKSCLKLALQII